MKGIEDGNKVIMEGVKDFHLDHIFDSGQCFRWEKEEDGSYTGVAYGRVLNINHRGDKVILENTSLQDWEEIWKPYLDFNRDYGEIKRTLSNRDEVMKKAISHGEGIRILRQDKWETLISFIISQNNNIPRIKKCVENLCHYFGDSLGEYKGREFYGFPTIETLAQLTLKDLEPIMLGYRGKYILSASKAVAEDGGKMLNSLGEADYDTALEYLLGLPGVGPKVASCIMLYSMDKCECFPLDVWMKRVMNQLYGIDEKNTKAMEAYVAEHFGIHAGIAQQYLFYYIRQLKE
ncbi:MAG: DNA-3-methyladenine glycosylase family protein [Anaerovoracaceae bacterium]|jgi:N-glycosylase/DNA lyase